METLHSQLTQENVETEQWQFIVAAVSRFEVVSAPVEEMIQTCHFVALHSQLTQVHVIIVQQQFKIETSFKRSNLYYE